MHYDGRVAGFTLNPSQNAIIAKDPGFQNTMGQRNGPSFIDFKEVNSAYCSNVCPTKLGCQHSGYEDPNNCNQCKCPEGFGGTLCETVEPSSCGGVMEPRQDWQDFSSPGYPGYFPAGSQCSWLIRVKHEISVMSSFASQNDRSSSKLLRPLNSLPYC